MNPVSDLTRLSASLAVSCLLHAALVFAPYLGMSAGVSLPAVDGGPRPGTARALDATLVPAKSPAAAAEAAASAEGVADAPAHPIAGADPRPALERAKGIGLLPLPAPAYYSTDQLTKPTRPSSEPVLNLRELGPVLVPGKIILKLWINELGNVIEIDVEKTELPEAYSRTAVEAFRNLRFDPGEINGRPVGTVMRIEVTYNDLRKRRR